MQVEWYFLYFFESVSNLLSNTNRKVQEIFKTATYSFKKKKKMKNAAAKIFDDKFVKTKGISKLRLN